ncbi:helix-turn-helix domain-containing protein [Streptomyces malaysiensis]|uniref:helix-turn-helix domain-containing protein n=1 Tax=Streptomyces malaysiensis TaxID=92644 RepID=UPI0027E4C49F|nr:helix-turn-helix domain-containing protein [Streptomyces sp. DR7-3]
MSANVGKRLHEVRKRRGMTQRQLASASGVSLSLIRKLEQGERADTRLETARQLAQALRVPTTTLIAEHQDEPETAPGADDRWEPVRRTLMAPVRVDGVAEEPTVHGVREALESALPLFSDDRFAELSVILPPLLRDADLIAENGPEGRAVRVRLSQLTGWLLTQTRQFDAADVARPGRWKSPRTGFRQRRRSVHSAGSCCGAVGWLRRVSWPCGGQMRWNRVSHVRLRRN